MIKMERVDELLENVKRRQREENKEEHEKQRALDDRRKDAVRRIGEAAITHLDLNVLECKNLAEKRMLDAEKGRLSRAQALADLAERGDFESDPWWWDIREQSEDSKVTLWKGYVKYHRVVRKQFRTPNDFIDLNIREKVRGGYVAEVLGNYGVSAAVNDTSPRRAALAAYNAYQSKVTGSAVTVLPTEFDFKDEDICKAPPMNSFDREGGNRVG